MATQERITEGTTVYIGRSDIPDTLIGWNHGGMAIVRHAGSGAPGASWTAHYSANDVHLKPYSVRQAAANIEPS